MLYLAFIFHMHQPYYKNLLTQETGLPWVRLHGVKDYLDMVQILEKYPAIHQTFNVVPSLIEQIEDYASHSVKDKLLELSRKEARNLTQEDKNLLLENFFSINTEHVISLFPRYYALYFKKLRETQFNEQDYLDLQLLFNLAWIDPSFRESYPELKALTNKGRFYSETDKQIVLNIQIEILKGIIPAYKKFMQNGQIELSVSPYYHPILPLLYSTNTAKEAKPKAILPKIKFSYPEDAKEQINSAVEFYKERFAALPLGMWPSEESVCEHILPLIMQSGIKWIVTDEAILLKSLKAKKRDPRLIYQPHRISREEGELNIVFRDRNLSDLIGFVYHKMPAKNAVDDFMSHLTDIHNLFKNEDILVTIAMDGENAWEYYPNDGHDFLNLLYQRLSESDFIKTTTINQYLKEHKPVNDIKRLACGSWIYGNFGKWIGSAQKVRGWEILAEARKELEKIKKENSQLPALILKQMYVLEGSDWFWWLGEDPDGSFDRIFRMHLANFYSLINKNPPDYLKRPITS